MSKDTNSTRANLGQALLSLELFKSVITREPIEYIKNLIDRGADVNITLNNGDTPLYEVC
ncbi:MAG: hypothetical protein EB127_12895 [Alphaproteobacteria bacterium]|nr:hypothetical protein [Alphaproteobacteria bacterium]